MKKVQIILKKRNLKTKKIYEEIVEYNEDITILDLSFKSLIEIPLGLEQFKNLEILYLYKNNISKIQFLTADGKLFNENNLINLKELNLLNNQISKIENLNNLINLTYLDLKNNQITKIENLDNLINFDSPEKYYNYIVDRLMNLRQMIKNDSYINSTILAVLLQIARCQ